MTHTINLRFRDDYLDYLDQLDSDADSTADQDFHSNASEVQCSDSLVFVTIEKTSLSDWLKTFHNQHEDKSGLCQRYRILSVNSDVD